jgi:hypothetical protein
VGETPARGVSLSILIVTSSTTPPGASWPTTEKLCTMRPDPIKIRYSGRPGMSSLCSLISSWGLSVEAHRCRQMIMGNERTGSDRGTLPVRLRQGKPTQGDRSLSSEREVKTKHSAETTLCHERGL